MSQHVYAQLTVMAQPGGPLMRERESGIYHYRVRPGFDLSEYHKATRVTQPKPTPPAVTPPATPKPAAAQAPCYSEVKPKAIELGNTSSERPNSVPPTPAGNKRTGEDLGQDEHRVPAQPASAAAPQPEPAKPKPSAPAIAPEREIPRFLPLDDPNPHRAEVLRFIGDLRIRREAIDEVIRTLETTFGVKS
jgi:hypothetical protein